MNSRKILVTIALVGIGFLFFPACGHKEPVRHLASDVCLLVQGQSTKQEVLTYLGPPDERRSTGEGTEEWIYYETRKSLMRKTPLVGNRLGYEEKETAVVSFDGDVVRACVIRQFDDQKKTTGTEQEE
jgi:hypothetical protein